MKVKLCVNRKAGAPGYGSDGAAAELEIDFEPEEGRGFAQQIADAAAVYYKTLEQAVDAQLQRMQSKHPQPAAAAAEPLPVHNGQPYNPDHVRPVSSAPPGRRQPEAGWSQEDEDQTDYRDPESGPPPRGNGYSGRQEQRNGQGNQGGWKGGPPRTGGQLWKWACAYGLKRDLEQIAAQHSDRGEVRDWDGEFVAWVLAQLRRQPERPAGSGRWGGSGGRN
jgi:hypothetical protein